MATTESTLARTNEAPGTRAKLSGLRTSAYKVREVLDLIRGEHVGRANEILTFCERGPAVPVQKLLNSAVANAVNNDDQSAEELFVSACFADEGPTMKRIKPGARGRAGRIRKRSSSVTIIVARLPQDRLERLRANQAQDEPSSRRRRVSGSRANRVARSRQSDPLTESELTETDVHETELIDTPEEATPDLVPAEDGITNTDDTAIEDDDTADTEPDAVDAEIDESVDADTKEEK
jgi:large subunit ribosomal protein L22